MKLDVNTDALQDYTKKLASLSRSAFPVAVRGALNNAAFDVKQNTMLNITKNEFEQRKPTFFKATSKVDMAKGWDVSAMQSTVGFSGNQQAVEDLELQERGGKIKGRAYIPMEAARVSKSHSKNVRANYRLAQIKNRIVHARKQEGSSKEERFIHAVLQAGSGGFVQATTQRGEVIVWHVNSLSSKIKSKKLDITPIYNYSKGRSVQVKKTSFMQRASGKSAGKIDGYYITQAEKQFAKVLR